MLLLLLALALSAKHKPHYTFDPYSITKVEYSARDCKRKDDAMVCKRAFFTFGAIRLVENDDSEAIAAGPTLAGTQRHTGPDAVVLRFKPKNCKPLHDLAGRYECRDVSWRHQ